MENQQKTAVEWLIEKLEIFATEKEMNIIDQALEMERKEFEKLEDFDYWKEWKNRTK
jgi:hypothetical protein